MASEVLRPNAVEFLDRMMRDQGEKKVRIEELVIPPGNRLVGRSLAETSIRNAGALVVAARLTSGEFVYNPPGSLVLEAQMALVVLTAVEDLQKLREAMANDRLLSPEVTAR